jgi:hypothetical protein
LNLTHEPCVWRAWALATRVALGLGIWSAWACGARLAACSGRRWDVRHGALSGAVVWADEPNVRCAPPAHPLSPPPDRITMSLSTIPTVDNSASQRPEAPGQTDVWGWPASRPPAGQKSSSSGGGACSHGVRGSMSARPRANRGPRCRTTAPHCRELRLSGSVGVQPLSSVWLWRFHSMCRALHSLTRIENNTGFGPVRVPLTIRASRHAMFGRQLRHRRPHMGRWWRHHAALRAPRRRWLFASGMRNMHSR